MNVQNITKKEERKRGTNMQEKQRNKLELVAVSVCFFLFAKEENASTLL
jgi:hypothetical protein